MTKNYNLLIIVFTFFIYCNLHSEKIHTGKIELSAFLGTQYLDKINDSTLSLGMSIGLDIIEIGIIEFSFENALGDYDYNKLIARDFALRIKKIIYEGEMFQPFLSAGISLLTLNKKGHIEDNESRIKDALLTKTLGFGFKLRIKGDFFALANQIYSFYSENKYIHTRSSFLMGFAINF